VTAESPEAAQPSGERRSSGPEHSSTDGRHPAFPVKLRLFEELKRRNLFRVAVLYLIACWVVLEPTHVVFHMLEVPEWANRLVILLMVIGFPPVLLFSWIYEVTPEGLKPTSDVHPGESITHKTGRKLDRAIIAVLALAVVVLLADKFWFSRQPGAPAAVAPGLHAGGTAVTFSDKSIAVLPFVDMSEKKDQEYFSDGLAEELLDLLAKVPELHVIARTSSFYFKGKQVTVADIAKTLGVANILEGSVRKSGNRLRVTTQLIRTDTGEHLWSETYDREMRDVFAVQDEIAGAVVSALKATMLAGAVTGEVRPANLEAYNLLLQARYAYARRTEADLRAAGKLLENALKVDPNYAPAWVALGWVQYSLGGYIDATPEADTVHARMSARRTLELDPRSGEAHLLLAAIAIAYDYDRATAAKQIEEAARLQPGSLRVREETGRLALQDNDITTAVRDLSAVVDKDPLNANAWLDLAIALQIQGRPDDAESAARRALEVSPKAFFAHYLLCVLLIERGRFDSAIEEVLQEPNELYRLDGLAVAYDRAGRKAESRAALQKMLDGYSSGGAYQIAQVYAKTGDKSAALDWLERAYRQHDGGLPYARADQAFKDLTGEARFQALMKKMAPPA